MPVADDCSLTPSKLSSTSIYINGCGLESFDANIPFATLINFANNLLVEVPSAFTKAPGLEYLILSFNSITSYNSSLVFPELAELYLNSNPLESFDASGSSLPELQILDLSFTKLNAIPKTMGTFSALRNLYLVGLGINNINEKLPATLETIHLSNNHLTSFELSGSSLPQLKFLNLCYTPLNSMPKSMGTFSKLTTLYIIDAGIKNVNEILPATLQVLYLSNNRLTSFDPLGSSLPSIRFLDLSNTQLQAIPKSIGTFSKLEYLGISSAGIKDFDVELPTSLHSLFLSNNSLTVIPPTIKKLNKLYTLVLNGNPLTSFDISGSSLPSLQFLGLAGSKLNKIPVSIGTFSNLAYLSLANAGIHEINIELPVSLTALDLSNNLLQSIPTSIYKLGNLKKLNLKGNPFDTIILSADDFKFLSNLETLHMTASSPSNCPKLSQLDDLMIRFNKTFSYPVSVCVTGNFDNNANESKFPWILVLSALTAVGLLILGILYRHTSKSKSKLKHLSALHKLTYIINTNRKSQQPISEINSDDYNQDSYPVELSILYDNLQVYRIDLKDIADIKSVGSGAFAVVWLVKYRSDRLLASKRLRTDELSVFSSEQMDAFTQEIQMVSMFKHTNIVEFVGVAWDGTDKRVNLQMLFEYMGGGDLRDCLLKNPDTSAEGPYLPRYWNSNKIAIARDIAAALVYLHSFRPPILHRDLKAKNILLTDDYSVAKLSDFGVARIRSQNATTMTSGVGTGRWLAPEIANGYTQYNESCDIYSFGIVLMELETHDIPYINVKNEANEPLPDFSVLYKIFHDDLNPMIGFSQDRENGGHEGIYALAEQCLSMDPKSRPSALTIMQELDNLLQLTLVSNETSNIKSL